MGSGGVGGYVGGRLAASGEDVAFIARGAHLAALREHGLRIESALGDLTLCPAEATDDPGAIGPVELVIFAVKLYDTASAAGAARPLVGPATGVLTLQNGVASMAALADALGGEHVIGGAAHIASTIAAPGVIRHTGTLARLHLGEPDGGHSERVAALSDALDRAGVDHQVSDDIARDIWAKMAFLATFSGLTALTRLPIGRVREDPETRALYAAGLTEALAVAHAKGIALPADFVARTLDRTNQLPAAMKSSLLHDLENGRRLELPWLSGAIVRMGRELGVPTPTHAFITTALKLHAGGG